MKQMLQNLFIYLGIKKPFKIQSFTYFIPAPKQFSQQYREKQFDRIFYDFINRGYEIIEIKTEICSREEGSGMWFICVVRAKNDQANLILEENEEVFETKKDDEEFVIIPE